MAQVPCEIAVDIGGTFTDVVLEHGGDRLSTKVLTDHERPEQAVLEGVARLLREAGVTGAGVTRFLHGTTLATNALIERRGARTALVTTQGFRDVLEMAHEHRFDAYDLFMQRPDPLVPREWRFEVAQRCTARGEVLTAPDAAAWEHLAAQLRAVRIEAVAVGFLHSYAHPAHEQEARAALERLLPGVTVCVSHEVCPEIREYERLCTTVANAYVRPVMDRYLARLVEALSGRLGLHAPVLLMTSAGGLTTVETARRFPVRLVESGPSGGVILARHVAQEMGADQLVAFDMGGTTAKLCLVDHGRPQEARLFEVGRSHRFRKGSGIPLRIPVIELVEIGAGGGSIAAVDAMGRIAVGPHSAGSVPGPACYGRGGDRPTVTDADLLLGRIDPERFGDGHMRLQPPLAEQAVTQGVGQALGMAAQGAALGISEIVDEAMAAAARVHAIEQGRALQGRTLVATGGAGPLHAARLAQKLGIDHIVVPRDAGVGSAVGFLRAPVSFQCARSLYQRQSEFDLAAVNHVVAGLTEEARAVVRSADPHGVLRWTLRADARYVGQGHEIPVELPGRPLRSQDLPLLHAAFEAADARHYARTIDGHDVEWLSWMVVVEEEAGELPMARSPHDEAVATREQPSPRWLIDPVLQQAVQAAVWWRPSLRTGTVLQGPALIVETQTTTVVPAGFSARVHQAGHLVLTREATT